MSHDATVHLLDLTASFADVTDPTPFGIYDADVSFKDDADGIVKMVHSKLGGNVLQVELTNKDVYACFEEAMLNYSSLVNSYHAKSVLADVLGAQTGSLSGSENKFARMSLSLAKRRADAFSSEALVGGTRALLSSSVDLSVGQQNYDLNYIMSASGLVTNNQRVEVREVYHTSPSAAYRFFDTTSAVNYLHNQFNFESFTPETIFYLLPIWEDVLRAQQLEMSHKIRRSNYSYSIVNNVLKVYPVPTLAAKMHFTYYLQGSGDDPFSSDNDPLVDGISNLSNIPFGNIQYSKINSSGQNWVRRFTLALSKEVLGLIRGKTSSIPIPNGELTLNSAELLMAARDEQDQLKNELRTLLDETTYDALSDQEARQAQNLMEILARAPMGIFVG